MRNTLSAGDPAIHRTVQDCERCQDSRWPDPLCTVFQTCDCDTKRDTARTNGCIGERRHAICFWDIAEYFGSTSSSESGCVSKLRSNFGGNSELWNPDAPFISSALARIGETFSSAVAIHSNDCHPQLGAHLARDLDQRPLRLYLAAAFATTVTTHGANSHFRCLVARVCPLGQKRLPTSDSPLDCSLACPVQAPSNPLSKRPSLLQGPASPNSLPPLQRVMNLCKEPMTMPTEKASAEGLTETDRMRDSDRANYHITDWRFHISCDRRRVRRQSLHRPCFRRPDVRLEIRLTGSTARGKEKRRKHIATSTRGSSSTSRLQLSSDSGTSSTTQKPRISRL